MKTDVKRTRARRSGLIRGSRGSSAEGLEGSIGLTGGRERNRDGHGPVRADRGSLDPLEMVCHCSQRRKAAVRPSLATHHQSPESSNPRSSTIRREEAPAHRSSCSAVSSMIVYTVRAAGSGGGLTIRTRLGQAVLRVISPESIRLPFDRISGGPGQGEAS
jgi:hypothetical protein